MRKSIFARVKECQRDGVPLSKEEFASLMLATFHDHHDPDYTREAERLVPGAGTTLFDIKELARGDITVKAAMKLVKQKLEMQERFRQLMPEFVRYLKLPAERDLLSLVTYVDSCHSDFPLVAESNRKDKQRRLHLKSLAEAEVIIRKAQAMLRATDMNIRGEFEDCQSAYFDKALNRTVKRGDEFYLSDGFSRFLLDLDLCEVSLGIARLRAINEPSYLYVSDNQTKTHVVAAAHELCANWNGPELVTTPTSEFSIFCGLLYEIVSGETEAGLLGAIRRYAKSPKRNEAEIGAEFYKAGWVEPVDENNFHAQDAAVKRMQEEMQAYAKLIKDGQLDARAQQLAGYVVIHKGERLVRLYKEYGPFPVRDNESAYTPESEEKARQWLDKRKKEDFELGRERRGEKSK